MGRLLNPRSVALVALVMLVTVVAMAMTSAADETMDDWEVRSRVTMNDTIITISGELTIDQLGSLHLDNCELRFVGGEVGNRRIHLAVGSMVLVDSIITSVNGGLMQVEGDLEIKGQSRIEHMDIYVGTRGAITMRDADVTLRGSYTSSSDNDPLKVTISGSATLVDSSLSLEIAFISSTGTLAFTRSSADSAYDFGWRYTPPIEHIRFDDGIVSLVDSTFSSLDGGIRSMADLSARDTTFTEATLNLHTPTWLAAMDAWIDGCTFTDSDLEITVVYTNHTTKALDILIEDIVMDGGHLDMDLQEAFAGSLVVDDATISGYAGYGVIVKASGVDGDLILESLDVDGPWGVQIMYDYSGLHLVNSTITAEQTALDLVGEYSSVPAFMDGLTVSGNLGLKAKNTVVKVEDSDLTLATVPVWGEGGASIGLTNCLVDESSMVLNVEPGERPASIKVDRQLVIDNVRWFIGDPIEEGKVLFFVYSGDTLFPSVKEWTIGSPDLPLIRIFEWTLDDGGVEERLVFDNVDPSLYIDGNTFQPDDDFTLDPWEVGPFQLVFKDEINPWITVSGEVPYVINNPEWVLYGTVGDAGTGIDAVMWALYTPLGELVDSGEVDYLSDGRWQTTIDITGDFQVVHLFPKDRSGNEELLPLQGVDVDVPTPLLTVVRPDDKMLTNVDLITVSGISDFWAKEIHIQVLGHTEVVVVPVISGRYSKIFQLPQEGLNDLIISSHDPFGGFDEKRVAVYLDTIAPAILLDALDPSIINHLNTPALVISGSVDDSRAKITVIGQAVGLVGNDFATTVILTEGSQTVKVKAVDEAGNENLMNLRLRLDTQDPMITLVNPKVSPFWSTEYEVEVVMDVDEDLASATFNGEDVQVTDGRITRTVQLNNRPYNVIVKVTDLAGNVANQEIVLRLDTDDPTLDIISPQEGQMVNTTAIPISVTSLDSGCTLFVDGVTIDTSEPSPGRLMGIMYLPPGEGKRTVTFTIQDRAGNTRSKDRQIEIDTVIPGLDPGGVYDGMKVTTEPLKINGWTEPDSKVVYVNGQMASLSADGRFKITIELKEGWQNITFVVLDKAGNRADHSYRVKALGEPSIDPPITALAAGTILVTLGALAVTTEAGKWTALSFLIPLYTKLRKDKILDQRTRGLIEGYITANPGCNYTIIRDNLDLADGTLTYHLQVLEREGFVYSIREGLFRCFYPQGVPPPRRGKLHLSDTQADIVRIVKRIPGITVGEVATAMNRRPNVISYHLKLLKEGGLVRMEEDGRHVRVYPIDTAVAMI
jgi:DNA-binding transcriptional ArsR family regulator